MRTVLKGVGFSQRAHFDCVEQAFEVTLRYLGHELEDVLFAEWRFTYVRAEARDGHLLGPGPPVDRVAKFQEYGGALVYRRCSDPQAALERIQALVALGRPAPVWVDPFFLPHYSPQNPRHTVHAVVVVGFDHDAGTVRIVDPSPWQLFRGDVEAGSLMQALNSHHLDERERNSWVEFDGLGERRARGAEEVGRQLTANIQAMLGDGAGRRIQVAGRGGVLYEGVAGMRQFATDMRAWADLEADALRVCQRSAREPLQQVARRRYGHARYLANAGRGLGVAAISSVALALEELAEAWFLPGNLLFKGSRREPGAMLDRAACRVEALADQEAELLRRLAATVRLAG